MEAAYSQGLGGIAVDIDGRRRGTPTLLSHPDGVLVMRRPLILGMNNPLSDDPEYDLYPYPEGSAGHRLWKMIPGDVSRRAYLDAFDRRNLLRARQWDPRAAREAARVLTPELEGRLVLVLGTQVRAALGLPVAEPLARASAAVGDGASFEWIAVPHPSGLNRWYNDQVNCAAVGELLRELMGR